MRDCRDKDGLPPKMYASNDLVRHHLAFDIKATEMRVIAGLKMGSSVLSRHTYIDDMSAFCKWSGCPIGGVRLKHVFFGSIEVICKAQSLDC